MSKWTRGCRWVVGVAGPPIFHRWYLLMSSHLAEKEACSFCPEELDELLHRELISVIAFMVRNGYYHFPEVGEGDSVILGVVESGWVGKADDSERDVIRNRDRSRRVVGNELMVLD